MIHRQLVWFTLLPVFFYFLLVLTDVIIDRLAVNNGIFTYNFLAIGFIELEDLVDLKICQAYLGVLNYESQLLELIDFAQSF